MRVKSNEDVLLIFISGFIVATIIWFVTFSLLQGNVLWAKVFKAPDPLSRSIPILSVTNESGISGTLTIKTVPGDGGILIKTSPFIGTDIQYSANVALDVARKKTNTITPYNDFIIIYDIPSSSISGPSGGAALTTALIALLLNKSIKKDLAITGAIRPDGKIGSVGGIMLKTEAAAKAGFKRIIIPEWQSIIVNTVNRGANQVLVNGTTINIPHYEREIINLTEYARIEWGMEVMEVSDIMDIVEIVLE